MSGMSFLERLLDGAAVEWKPLGDVVLPTSNIKWKNTDRIYRYIDLTSVSLETKKIAETTEITANNAPSRAQKLVEKDDVIFATTRPAQQRYCLIDNDYSGEVASTGYCILRAKKDEVLPKWILYCIASNDFIIYVEENQSGSAYPAISDAKVKDFVIPIPPLAIQSQIVRILDTFTELTHELTRELTLRKKQYEYYRDRLLTFEEGEVEWKTLGEITRIFSASRVHKNEWTTSGVPFFRTSDVISIFNGVKNSRDDAFISNELYETLSSKSGKIQKNDILVTGGGTIGIPYIVPNDEPLYFKDADLLCIKKSKTLNSKFLYHYFLTTKFRIYLENISHNSTIAHYTISQITKTPVPILPLSEQARIVAILDKFDTLTTSISEGLPREIALRQQQYEYYRDLLLSFPKPEGDAICRDLP